MYSLSFFDVTGCLFVLVVFFHLDNLDRGIDIWGLNKDADRVVLRLLASG